MATIVTVTVTVTVTVDHYVQMTLSTIKLDIKICFVHTQLITHNKYGDGVFNLSGVLLTILYDYLNVGDCKYKCVRMKHFLRTSP